MADSRVTAALIVAALLLTVGEDLVAEDAATRLYVDAVLHHTAGEVDQALVDVAKAPPETFSRVARNLDGHLRGFRDLVVRNAVRHRAALLHTDIALLLPDDAAKFTKGHAFRIVTPEGKAWPSSRGVPDTLVYSMDGRYLTTEVESGHWAFASWILSGIQPDPESDAFVRAWYRAIAATFLDQEQFGSALYHLQRAREVLARDPVILFYAGATHEAGASPGVQNVHVDGAGWTRFRMLQGDLVPEDPKADLSERGQLRSAERAFRAAIDNGAPPEAQVRLGRVLGRLGKHREAAALLQQVDPGPETTRVSYLRELLLGTELGALGRDDDARACFARAAALYPAAQSPWVALSDVARRAGDRAGALAALRRLSTVPAEPDPWWDYYRSSAFDAEAQLAAVRAWPIVGDVR